MNQETSTKKNLLKKLSTVLFWNNHMKIMGDKIHFIYHLKISFPYYS